MNAGKHDDGIYQQEYSCNDSRMHRNGLRMKWRTFRWLWRLIRFKLMASYFLATAAIRNPMCPIRGAIAAKMPHCDHSKSILKPEFPPTVTA
jgi:hypothetical protein